ncbi:MAG: TonB-dependent receptor [Acidobacteriota bacterium]|nr:TonB-dependent receptor [Acidobacteriota bacterium]
MTAPLARLCVLAVLIFTLSIGAFAQSQATTGNIEGRVLDPREAAVPGATVTATNQQTGLEKTTNSDSDGNYRLILLPPGSYTIRVTGQGFGQTELRDVTVTVGGNTPLELKLSIGGASESVTVTSEAPVVETTRSSVSTTVNERAIQNLPVSGRNYLDFATLTPGVVRDPTRGGDLAVGGQKGTLNNLQVDGVDNNNTFFGQAFGRTGVRPPYQFSEESVQEFQVNQNGFSAEFGRSGGAVINVVTKSGSNKFHGGAFEYFRDESLNANTPTLKATQFRAGLPNKRVPQQINQFGGRIGGPIVKNRAFFFFTYDGQRQNLSNPLDVPNITTQSAAIQALLAPKLHTYPIGRDQDVYMAKGDVAINKTNQLSLRFNRQNFTGVNNESTGPTNVEEHSGNSLAKTTTFSGTLASTITQKLVNEFRFQFAKDGEPGTANAEGPEIRIGTGVPNVFLTIGRNNFSPRETTIKRRQLVDNVLYVTGRHNVKTGLDFNCDRVLNHFPGLFKGQYTFNSYTDFFNRTNASFRQSFAGNGTTGPTTHPDTNDYAFYVQDDWRATPRLTINAGVRYDYQRLSAPPVKNPDPQLAAAGLDTSTQPKDKNNIAPRFGFSYAFDEKTVLRGGYGVFYGRTTGIMLGTAHSNNGINVINVNLSAAQVAAAGLVYPNIFSAPPTVGTIPKSSLSLLARDYVQPYVQQGRLGIEREVLPNTSLAVTYLFYRGVHISRTRDVNLGAPTPVTFIDPSGQSFVVQRFISSRPFVNFDRISLFESSAKSLYNALAVQLTRRFARNFQFLATYTYSKSKDDRPDQTAVVPGNSSDDSKIVSNPFNIRQDYGPSDIDIPHRFVFSPVYETGQFKRSENAFVRTLLSDYAFSAIVQLQSGLPYTALVPTGRVGTATQDLNNDGNSFNDLAPGTTRNQFRAKNIYTFDARISRSIRLGETMRLRLIAEGFNIFNRANIGPLPSGLAQQYVNTGRYAGFTGASAAGPLTLTLPSASSAFGLPRTFLPSREVQLAIKFDF